MKVLDLCTEFGSETAAFRDRGHDVETLGIVGNVTYLQDARAFHPTKKYDFITAHPPCTEFSIADWRKGPCKDRSPDMSIVEACFRIITEAKPRFWMLESPRGCLRHFIGRPQYTIRYGDFGHYCQKPTDLWGVLPWFQSYVVNRVQKQSNGLTAYTNGTHNTAQRALVPYGLSLAMCEATERELEG